MSELNSIKFFGKGDRKEKRDDGEIASQMPGWYFDVQLEDLENSIMQDESSLARKAVDPGSMSIFMSNLEKKKRNLGNIMDSKPQLNDKERDGLAKVYDNLSSILKEALPTRSDDKKGLVNPHKLHKLNTEKNIPVDGKLRKMFVNMGIEPKNNKISLNEVSRVVKISGKLLDRETNIEHFRRDYGQRSFKNERSLEEMDQDI